MDTFDKSFRRGFIDAMKELCHFPLTVVRHRRDEVKQDRSRDYYYGWLAALDYYEGIRGTSDIQRADRLGLTTHYAGFHPHPSFDHPEP